MSNKTIGAFWILCCCVFWVSGCAKKEMVRADESSISKPVEKTVAEPAVKETLTRDESTKEQTNLNVKEKTLDIPVVNAAETSLGTIYFDFDSYLLSSAARDTLSRNAEYLLKENMTVKIQIEGHCDERGSGEYNLALGERRAQSAYNYLVTLGVPTDRLSVISYGKELPVADGHDNDAWAQNRRDEFVINK